MAGRIPQSFIDELLARIDIVDVIDARVPLKKAGREYKACCPFHGEKTPSFTVSQVKQFYHCFGCGVHGTAITFLMEYEHMEFVEAIEELALRAGLEIPREAGTIHHDSSSRPQYELLEHAAAWYQEQLRGHAQAGRAIDYLNQRGLSGEVAACYDIGFAPPGWEHLASALKAGDKTRQMLLELGLTIQRDDGKGAYDRFRDRVMFPIHDRRGRTIGFGGRVLDNGTPKYMNSPESGVFHKGQELYGLFEARKALRKLERILVVEGYMDVVMLAQFDIQYAVATLGTATTPEHLETLFRTVPEVVFCFDGDRAGREAAWRALENTLPVLGDGREARFLFLPDGEDPDSLVQKIGKPAFEQLVLSAGHLSDYFFEHLSATLDIGSIDGRARLVNLARPLLARLPDGMFRQLMTERLAELARTSVASVSSRLEPPRGPSVKPQPAVTTRPAPVTGGKSPVRDAIALLLYQPALAQKIGDLPFKEPVDVPGVALLEELLELLQTQPLASTGAILEHWRDREEARHLARLAQWSPVRDDLDLLPDLQRQLHLIYRMHLEQRIDYLANRDKIQKLDEGERKEYWRLQTLLQEARQTQ
jgi:DNA primase